MNKLIENVTNIFGEQGSEWINNLPNTVEALAKHWQLRQILPVDNMTYNYVAKAITSTNKPVVLKISCDKKSSGEEMQALMYFDGNASVRLLDHNEKYHAMLLDQAIPGTTLKSFYPAQIEYVMDCYAATMNKLHSKRLPSQHHYRHISDWLKAIDRLTANHFPAGMFDHAIQIKNKLLSTMQQELFLHGDLHHDNLIKNNDEWLTIDPKGIIGDAEFEIAAFDFIHPSEFHLQTGIKNLFAKRIDILAEKSKLNAARIKDWVFVRLILSAAWSIEDNCEIGWDIELAKSLVD
ncbi:MAG TPA: aminoglycoside phosphotransferase family protein [Gammaproteobacteria bacterium]|jgi:streptomycin 6-kinase|nr:aminoglycoside phosphotransferase family protein [Gammaproteobacteria bacterium]